MSMSSGERKMPELKLSVVIPTRDRPGKLSSTLGALTKQRDFDNRDYEVIVVDDGSDPPVRGQIPNHAPLAEIVRLAGAGPSAARNRGAGFAKGSLLVFLDDDLQVDPGFLTSHWQAHLKWPEALQVGSIRLPEELVATPFGRFRQRLEDQQVPTASGPVKARNFCTAANMAIERSAFQRLGGFDEGLNASEDQDLALRHTDSGGEIVFAQAARAIHNDEAVDLDSYCLRAERGMEDLVAFAAQHPDRSENVERARVNGPVRWGREPITLSAKKLAKRILMLPPVRAATRVLISVLERLAPDSELLDRFYRALLGAHLQRGYRRGLRRAHG
jgi:GT2 family glycosyltransferase